MEGASKLPHRHYSRDRSLKLETIMSRCHSDDDDDDDATVGLGGTVRRPERL